MDYKCSGTVQVLRTVSRFIAIVAILIAQAALAQVAARSPGIATSSRSTQKRPPVQSSGSSLFLPVVTYNSGAAPPVSIAVGDLNGDSKPDLVVANCVASGSVGCGGRGVLGVLLGNGDGTFRPAVTYDSGGFGASSVAVADLNGDGKLDLVVANQCGSTPGCPSDGLVDVLLGNGDGTFQPAVPYASGGYVASSVAVGDIDGDGKPDIVVANFWSNTVGILRGNGDGTFQRAVTYDAGPGPTSLAIADVNGDRVPDIVVANQNAGVSVLLGETGGFKPPTTYTSGGFASYSVAVADLNGDGRPDLVVANLCALSDKDCTGQPNAPVGVLLGNGDGTFQNVVTYDSGGAYATSVAVTDIDGDGKLDLVSANINSSNIGALLGKGDGTFQPAFTFSAGGHPWFLAAADVNGDAKPDLLVANNEGLIGVLLNNSTHLGPTTTTLTSSLNPSLVGQVVTFTATVTSSSGNPPNGETITFYNGTTVMGTAPLKGGVAALTTSALSAGVFTLKASYPGDSNFAPSTSPGLRQVVNSTTKSVTSTTLASSLNPSIYGQKLTLTSTVTTTGPLPPTGTVAFTWSDGSRTFTIGSATLNSSGVATLVKSNLYAVSYPLTAVYRGDTNNLASTSPILNQVIQQATSAATITSSLNPSSVGQAVTFTAKITSPTVIPTGPVTFKAGTTVLGTAQLSSGKASFMTSSLPAGSTAVKVIFNGDSNIKGSSAAVTQVVQP